MVWKPLRAVSITHMASPIPDSPAKYSIELLAACRYFQDTLALLTKLMCGLEATS